MKVHQFVNPYRNANTYLLELANDEVVLVDVGNLDVAFLTNWLTVHHKKLTHVFVTHEHGDHCCGLELLHERIPFQLLCSPKCLENMADPKQNFSYYVEEMPTVSIRLPNGISLQDASVYQIQGTTFSFVHTPGHSPGSSCIFVENKVFTGDTLLNGIKTPLTFPHSNKADYQTSLIKLQSKLKPGIMIYPGHDLPFVFTSFDDLKV